MLCVCRGRADPTQHGGEKQSQNPNGPGPSRQHRSSRCLIPSLQTFHVVLSHCSHPTCCATPSGAEFQVVAGRQLQRCAAVWGAQQQNMSGEPSGVEHPWQGSFACDTCVFCKFCGGTSAYAGSVMARRGARARKINKSLGVVSEVDQQQVQHGLCSHWS
jgi:hypothetical protein